MGNQGDQLLLAELSCQARRHRARRGASVSWMANSLTAGMLIAAPRSCAARVRSGPSARVARRSGSWRRCAWSGRSRVPSASQLGLERGPEGDCLGPLAAHRAQVREQVEAGHQPGRQADLEAGLEGLA